MPVDLYHAYTAPINPAGATPVLTQAQVWAGLQRKIRHAPEFVSAITTCDVLSDGGSNGEVVREVVFAANPGVRVKEVVRSYEPLKVDFHQADGSLVSNVVSDGPDGEDRGDMYMTYAFMWLGQKVEAGSEEHRAALERSKKGARGAVEGSIETIRRLVREGKI